MYQRKIPIENPWVFAFFLIFHSPLFPRYNDTFIVCKCKTVRVMLLFILEQENETMQVCMRCVRGQASHGHSPLYSSWHQFISRHSDFLQIVLLDYAENFEETGNATLCDMNFASVCSLFKSHLIGTLFYNLAKVLVKWKLEFHLSLKFFFCYFITLTNNQMWFILPRLVRNIQHVFSCTI